VTIELRAQLKPPVYAHLRSPSGIAIKLRLRRASPTRWRVAYAFLEGGRWTLRAAGAKTRVVVRAPLAAPPPASAFVPLGGPGCKPPSPANAVTGEVRGTATIGDLWAVGFWLNLGTRRAAIVDDVVDVPFKITWRMRGSGDARFTAIAPDGTHRSPLDLRPHVGSNWNRPGAEWGSVFVFSQPGCWQMHVERRDNSGDIWLLVRS